MTNKRYITVEELDAATKIIEEWEMGTDVSTISLALALFAVFNGSDVIPRMDDAGEITMKDFEPITGVTDIMRGTTPKMTATKYIKVPYQETHKYHKPEQPAKLEWEEIRKLIYESNIDFPLFLTKLSRKELERIMYDHEHAKQIYGFFTGTRGQHALEYYDEILRRANQEDQPK